LKRYFLILYIFAYCIHLQAINGFVFGAFGGLNQYQLTGDPQVESFKKQSGFQGGLQSQYYLSDNIILQLDVMLAHTLLCNETLVSGAYEQKLTDSSIFLEFPLNVKYEYYFNDYFKTQTYIGPKARLLLKSERKWEYQYINGTNEEEAVEALMNDIDFGLNAGLDFIIINRYFMGARYNFGFNQSFKYSDIKDKNQSFMLNMGYLFN